MTQPSYPSGLRELPFVEAYYRTTLRRPQVVSDTILRSLMTSGQEDRLVLCASLADQLAEACRRLVVVHDALFERRYPIATLLARPLPGVSAWRAFVDRAATLPPESMARDLGLGEEGERPAELLRSQPDLGWIEPLIVAAESGNMLSLVATPEAPARRAPSHVWIGAAEGESDAPTGALTVDIDDAATLADTTADMVSVARGFLGAYLKARRGAGCREA